MIVVSSHMYCVIFIEKDQLYYIYGKMQYLLNCGMCSQVLDRLHHLSKHYYPLEFQPILTFWSGYDSKLLSKHICQMGENWKQNSKADT